MHNDGSPLTTQGEGIARMSGQTSFVQQAPVHPETSARFGDFHPPLDRQAAIPDAFEMMAEAQ